MKSTAVRGEKYRQAWFCDACGAVGVVVYTEADSDVSSVARQIREGHRNAARDCQSESHVLVLSNVLESSIVRHPSRQNGVCVHPARSVVQLAAPRGACPACKDRTATRRCEACGARGCDDHLPEPDPGAAS